MNSSHDLSYRTIQDEHCIPRKAGTVDEVLASALLDRLLYRCEIINLTGKSYRLSNRKTIFES
ncbi:MAG: ATP-binding protein [Chryseolinea sp.]